jgi:chemotaxis methyl-accepting protein methylase
MQRDGQSCVKWNDPELDEPMAALIRAVPGAQGVKMRAYDETFVRKAIAKRLLVHGIECVPVYGEYLARHPEEVVNLSGSLRIGYSEFFRNPLTFALLEQWILPSLAAEKKHSGRGEIRVWSAGCAAGQEAWSVAMQLEALSGPGEPRIPYRIFATDLAEADLATAESGVYSAEAVGNIRTRFLHEYFSRQGESFVIVPQLRERVNFSVYDLLDESSSSPEASLYGDFDLIFCSNLLFYYRSDIRRQILGKVCRALAPGGYVVTGEAERDMVAGHEGLHAVAPPVAVFQKTCGARSSMLHIAPEIFNDDAKSH